MSETDAVTVTVPIPQPEPRLVGVFCGVGIYADPDVPYGSIEARYDDGAVKVIIRKPVA